MNPAPLSETARRALATDWCMKLAEGRFTLEDHAALESWLEESPDNRATFERVSAIWNSVPDAADMPELIGARADALEALRASNQRRWRRPPVGWRAMIGIAACLALVVMGALFWPRDAVRHYATGTGERQLVRLADGSSVSLDAATGVDVAYRPEARSLTLLSGRAKFDVAHDAARPFSVTAGGKTIVATGTSFSVELVQGQVRVVLYEGHVKVLGRAATDAPEPLRLPGARAPAADGSLLPGRELVSSVGIDVARVEPVDLPRTRAWEGGQLVFSDEPLALAVARVNRYSDRKLVIGDADTGGLRVSGAFNAGDTNGFVDGVTDLFPVRARGDGDRIVLSTRR